MQNAESIDTVVLFPDHNDSPPVDFVAGGNPKLRAYLTHKLDLIARECSLGSRASIEAMNRAYSGFYIFITKAESAGIELRERHELNLRSFDLRDLMDEIEHEHGSAVWQASLEQKAKTSVNHGLKLKKNN